jgi:hypothetical protein
VSFAYPDLHNPRMPGSSTAPVSAGAAGLTRSLTEELAPLWPAGAGLALALAGSWPHLGAPDAAWRSYAILGAATAALFASAWLWPDARFVALSWLRPAISAIALAGAAVFVLLHPEPVVLAGVALQLLAVQRLALRNGLPLSPARLVALFLVGLAGWAAGASLIWWSPLTTWVVGSPYSVAIAILALYLVAVEFWRADRASPTLKRVLGYVGAPAVLALFAIASLQTGPLFDGDSFHHWGFYAGTAELIRQGGWLLWDVPSQYGFLDELLIARLPLSIWESLYLLNALFNFALACLVFCAFRRRDGGLFNLLLATGLVLALVFIRPAVAASGLGPEVYPSTGGLRFLWLVAVMWMVFLSARREPEGRRSLLVAGTVVWLIGFLWSSESAIYCSVVWLPAYVLFTVTTTPRDALRRLAWLALPAAALVGAGLIVVAWYEIGLGHLPDAAGFIEYGLRYQAGVAAPLPVPGAVWVLFIGLSITVIAALQALRSGSGDRATAIAQMALAASVWAAGSYLMSREHPNNVWNVAGVLGVALALTFRLGGWNTGFARGIDLPLRFAGAPLLVFLLIGGAGYQFGVANALELPVRDLAHVESRLPSADPSLRSLLLEAGVRPDDPIVYLSPGIVSTLLPATDGLAGGPAWLPAMPLGELDILPPERRLVYIDRFLQDPAVPHSGWLVAPAASNAEVDGLRQVIERTHTLRVTYRNASWEIDWYQLIS